MGVMNVKRTTTIASGDHSGNQSAAARGPDAGASNISATDQEKALGGQNIGEVLNKVADANYIDPSKKHRATGNAQLDKDAFMKLMLAQMKYQDPQNPMQSHEMAAQLAQFTSLEQLNNIHTTLESMKNAQSPSVNYQALNFIGKKIASDSSRITRSVGDTTHPMTFQLLGDSAKTKITIKDAAGNTVRTLDVGALKKGPNSISWNGVTDEGVAARPGEYKMAVEAESATGNKVYAKTQLEGRITGLNYTPEGPVLMVGDQTVKMSEVKKIEEAAPEAAAALIPGAGMRGLVPTAAEAAPLRAPMAQAGAAGTSAGVSGLRMQVKPESKGPSKAAVEASAAAQSQVKVQAESKGPSRVEAEPKVAENSDHGAKSENSLRDSKAAVSNESMNVPPAEESTVPPGNIDSVPMAQGLINKLAQAK